MVVNEIYYVRVNCCLLKNTYHVMYNVRYISILDLSIFQFLISQFWSTICKLVGNPTYAGIIRRYARKVLFSGVFVTGSIFQDGGWDLDEAGRNG